MRSKSRPPQHNLAEYRYLVVVTPAFYSDTADSGACFEPGSEANNGCAPIAGQGRRKTEEPCALFCPFLLILGLGR